MQYRTFLKHMDAKQETLESEFSLQKDCFSLPPLWEDK